MKSFTKLLDVLTRALEIIVVIFMALDVISMLIQVVGRELGMAPPWTEELSRYLMIWIALLGGAVIVRESGHLGLDILTSRVKNPATKQALAVLSHICTIIVGVIMLYYGMYVMQQNFGQISPALRIAFAWVYLSLPVSGALIIIFSLEQWLLSSNKAVKE